MIINNQKNLNKFISCFKKKKFICIDTEFERKNTFFSKLSIISISDGKNYFVFDVIKNPEFLEKLRIILKRKSLLKIIHGGLQDIEIFNKQNFSIDPFFDTQIASGFLGMDRNISYANLVKKFFNKNLDKKFQNHDWFKRPITKGQLNYLKNDVIFLYKIYLKQKKNLIKQKKLNFAKEEFKIFKDKIVNNNGLNSKFKKKLDIEIYKNKNFLELIRIRDNISKKKDMPKNWILKDEEIIQLIKKKVNNKQAQNKFFSNNDWKKFCNLLNKIKKIKVVRVNNDLDLKTFEFFRYLVSKKYSIDPNLIATKYDLEDFKNSKTISKWRSKIYYDLVEKIIKGKQKFKIKNFKPLYQ